jgi:hypothetical protein
MDYQFEFSKCPGCGRKFLIEKILFGTDHTASTTVTCKECLSTVSSKFILEHPDEAKSIKEWLDDK